MRTHWYAYIVVFFMILLVLAYGYAQRRPDGKLHIVFCDVGQGDAIYLRFPNGSDMLVDGGSGRSVLSCLGKYMLFWDRSIDLVAFTHPQYDHYGGLLEVAKRYQIGAFFVSPIVSSADSYDELIGLIGARNIKIVTLYVGNEISLKKNNKLLENYIQKHHETMSEHVTIAVLWPDKEWVMGRSEKLADDRDEWELYEAHAGEDHNDFSLVLLVSYLDFDVLLTGDAEVHVLSDAIDEYFSAHSYNSDPIEILKVSHHGSENSVNTGLMHTIRSDIGVLSFGKNNRYGHPAQQTIDVLDDAKLRVYRTDQHGSIEVISDGVSYEVFPERQ